VSRIAAGKTAGQGHVATGFGRVWVLQGDGSTLAGIDSDTEAVGDPVDLPVRGTDLAVGEDAIWIVSALDDAVLVIDPDDGTLRHRIDGIDAPLALSIVGDAVWVGGSVAVHLIDSATGAIVSTIEGGVGGSGAVAGDDSGVWVRRDAEVRHIDADSGSETETFALDLAGSSPGDMLVAFGALWTTASEDAALFRIALE
jgi:DNA-binding beta-propeller fold protein YncE